MKNPKKILKAFSAIEISISIVITSIVVAALVFLQDLGKSTSIKALISQFTEYDTAVKQFYLKYNSIPGDTASTVSFGLSATNTDGNDDGLIEDAKGGTNEFSGEVANFWMHLSKSGFIKQNFDGAQNENAKINNSFPSSKIGDKVGVTAFGYDGKNYYQIGIISANKNRLIMSDKSLKPSEAFNFDLMIDDGLPTSGRVIATSGIKVNRPDKDKKCSDNKEYETSNNSPSCQLRIEFETNISD
jgi:hypothetical protein